MYNARTKPRVKGNRLVEVQRVASGDTTTIAEYEYDARNRRVSKTVTNCGVEESAGDGGDTTVHYYYDHKWRIVETRDGSNQATRQWVWGTRYTDELLFMDVNGDAYEGNDCSPDEQSTESTYDRRYFYHQDRQPLTPPPPRSGDDRKAISEHSSQRGVKGNWNVVAISEYDDGEGTDSRVVERYAYTPYGEFVVLTGDSGDGEMGAVRLTSTIGNPFAHQGLPFDQELGGYQNRHRWYDARKQRFGQRDPLGYRDGMDMYQYEASDPVRGIDPTGLGCRVSQPPSPLGLDRVCANTQSPVGGGSTVCDGAGGFIICVDPCASVGQPPCPVGFPPGSFLPPNVEGPPYDTCPEPPNPPGRCGVTRAWLKKLALHCTCQHEQTHIRDFNAGAPDACADQAAGNNPVRSRCFHEWSEGNAYEAAAQCFRDHGAGSEEAARAAADADGRAEEHRDRLNARCPNFTPPF